VRASKERTPIKLAAAFCFAVVLALTASASAQIEPFLSGNVVKIGVLTDMSSIYADIGGPGSVEAARMAIANQWFGNDGVDAMVGRDNFKCGPRRPGGRAQQEQGIADLRRGRLRPHRQGLLTDLCPLDS
jgi:hypothetical protein